MIIRVGKALLVSAACLATLTALGLLTALCLAWLMVGEAVSP